MSKGLLNKILESGKKNQPELLIAAGVVGLVSTTFMAVKATPRALNMMDDMKSDLGVTYLTKKEMIVSAWRAYAPSAALAVLSIGCIAAGTTKGIKRTSAIATAYALSENTIRTYHNKIVEAVGEEKAEEIKREVHKAAIKERPVIIEEESTYITNTGHGNTLFYDSLTGRYFRSSSNAVDQSINYVNKQMLSENMVYLNDLYSELDIPAVDVGNILGWDISKSMIEIKYDSSIEVDGQPYVIIEYVTCPSPVKTRCEW